MKIPVSTPWGKPQSCNELAEGILSISTAGHGGFKLDRKHNAQVNALWRKAGGWYEEDCEWAIVAITFPKLFNESQMQQAVYSLKNWHPVVYTQITGIPVLLEESFSLREEAFAKASVGQYVSNSAFGAWANGVPEGFVAVYAIRDGKDKKAFLVPEKTYRDRSFGFGLVFKEGDYPVIEDFQPYQKT